MSEFKATDEEVAASGFRLKQNVWGNWCVYIGRRKVADFGDEYDARFYIKHKPQWLRDQLK